MDSNSLLEELSNIFGMNVEVDRAATRQKDGQWRADVVPVTKRKRSRRSENCWKEAERMCR
jgi:hypothetical protein